MVPFPKSVLNHELGPALQGLKKDRLSPIFTTAADGIRWLATEAKRSSSKKGAKKMA
jgi:hypothetical protein